MQANRPASVLEMSDKVFTPTVKLLTGLASVCHPLPRTHQIATMYVLSGTSNQVNSRALKMIIGVKSTSGACADRLLSSAARYRSAYGI